MNARHLPTGFLFMLGAPFPPLARTLGDVAMIPEMLLWYLCLAFAAVGVVRTWREGRLAQLAYPLMILFMLFGLLSLVEGNVGTLVRHRAMVVPFVVILGAIGAGPVSVRLPGGKWWVGKVLPIGD